MHHYWCLSMTGMTDEALIERLRYFVSMAGIKLTELADAIDVPYRTLQNQFRGVSKMPAITLIRILDVLKLNSGHLHKNAEPIDTAVLAKALIAALDDDLPTFDITDEDSFVMRRSTAGLSARDADEVRRASHILASKIERAYQRAELERMAFFHRARALKREEDSQ